MTIAMSDVIQQNTPGNSQGYPEGLPSDYSWYSGATMDSPNSPAGFTAITGWGQIYPETGSSYTNSNATVDIANAQTWVHLKSTNQWVQVQNQATDPIAGGHFVADFAGNAGIAMSNTVNADGSATLDAPPVGYNDHFWPDARGSIPSGDVDGVYVQMDMKVSDPNLKLVANVGADFWRDTTAGYVDGFDNNPGCGMSNWVELGTSYKTVSFYNVDPSVTTPPPPVSGAITTDPKQTSQTDPITPVDPLTGSSGTATDPNTPSAPSDPAQTTGSGNTPSDPLTGSSGTATDPNTPSSPTDPAQTTGDSGGNGHARWSRGGSDGSGSGFANPRSQTDPTNQTSTDSGGQSGSNQWSRTYGHATIDFSGQATRDASGNTTFDVSGHATLGFANLTKSTDAGTGGDHTAAMALFRQIAAGSFASVGDSGGATPINDHTAVGVGHALANPRHG